MLAAVLILALRGIEDRQIELSAFPSSSVALTQLGRYGQHRSWLANQRSLLGDKDGRYSGWLKETDLALTYWQVLWDCHWTGANPDLLRRLIGSERYLDAWHPPLLPERPFSFPIPNAAGVMVVP